MQIVSSVLDVRPFYWYCFDEKWSTKIGKSVPRFEHLKKFSGSVHNSQTDCCMLPHTALNVFLLVLLVVLEFRFADTGFPHRLADVCPSVSRSWLARLNVA